MHLFCTGGTSFIGSHAVKALSEQGHTITVLAREPARAPGLAALPGVSLVRGTLSDDDVLWEEVTKANGVISIAHAPGEGPVARMIADTLPMLRMLEWAAQSNTELFLYTSSTAALGELSESMPEQRFCLPNAWWAANKAAGEKCVQAASFETAMRCMILRPSLTFGQPACEGAPTEAFDGFRTIVLAVRANEDIVLGPEAGTQMTDAADVARVYAQAVEKGHNRAIYHAVTPERTLWRQYAEAAIRICGSSSKIIVDAAQSPAFICAYEADNIEEHLGLRFAPWPALHTHIESILSQN